MNLYHTLLASLILMAPPLAGQLSVFNPKLASCVRGLNIKFAAVDLGTGQSTFI